MCVLCNYTFNFNYYTFDLDHSDNLGQPTQNGYLALSIKRAFNFIISTYLINHRLQHVYYNQSVFFSEVERLAKEGF